MLARPGLVSKEFPENAVAEFLMRIIEQAISS